MAWLRRLSPSPSATDWKLSHLAARHRGSCLANVTGALLVGRSLGLRTDAVAVPDHVLLQVEIDGRPRLFDLVEGTREFDAASARSFFKIPISSAAFLRPLSDDETVACFRIERAAEFIESDNLGAAVHDLHEAIRDFPTHPSGIYNLGVVQLKRKHWSRAEDLFSRAIALNPNDARPMFNRAFTFWRQGRREEARSDVREALRLSPGMSEAIRLRDELDRER